MKQSQHKRLIEYLEQNRSITQLEALKELGIFRLSARITELKKQGYKILGEMETVKNRFGEDVKIKRYYYISE